MPFPGIQRAPGFDAVVLIAGQAAQLVDKAVFRFCQAAQIVGVARLLVRLFLFFFAKIPPQSFDGIFGYGEIKKLRAAAGNNADRRKVTGYDIHHYFLLKRASHLRLAPPSSLTLHWVEFS